MKAVRHLVAMLAVLLPLVAPALACAPPNATPNATLTATQTAAERACCKQMQMQCEHAKMPTVQSCCDSQLPATGNAVVQQKQEAPQTAHAARAGIHAAALLPLPAASSYSVQGYRHTLPQSPPANLSTLRI